MGIDKDTFEIVLTLATKSLDKFHGRKLKVHASERKVLLSHENLLALVINWLYQYNSVRSLGVDFDVPEATIHSYLPRLVDILHQTLSQYVHPPKRIEPFIRQGPLAGACILVDTFPIPLRERPDAHQQESEDRHAYFWFAGGKQQHWAIKAQVGYGLDGTIWDSSHAVPYSVSDQTTYQSSKIPQILARNEELRGVGDQHFTKQKQFISKYRNPSRRSEKKINHELESLRASIEHVIQRVKNFNIILGPYRGDRKNLILVEKIIRVVCALVNLDFERHPLHKNK